MKDIKINGDLKERLPGNINVSFKGCDSNQILLELDKIGICASGGSACSSGSSLPSHVLLAIGLEKKLFRRKHTTNFRRRKYKRGH